MIKRAIKLKDIKELQMFVKKNKLDITRNFGEMQDRAFFVTIDDTGMCRIWDENNTYQYWERQMGAEVCLQRE